MHSSARILKIGSAAVLALATLSPASAMPTAPRSAVVDSADTGPIQVANRGWRGGGNWRGGYRAGYRWHRGPGYGVRWWGPGIAAGVIGGAVLAAPHYYGAPYGYYGAPPYYPYGSYDYYRPGNDPEGQESPSH
jgi:hypothetical protein